MIGRVHRLLLVVFTALCLPLAAPGQEPIDLFSDAPPLAEGYIRLATWNLRHINVEGQAANYIPGANYQEDLEILVATFAKAIEDLGLHVVALVEHVPRPDDPLQKIVAALNDGDAGPWRSDETNIEYDEDAHHNLQLAILWNSDRVTINRAQFRQGPRRIFMTRQSTPYPQIPPIAVRRTVNGYVAPQALRARLG